MFAEHDTTWHAWFDADEPENIALPSGYAASLSSFQHLCLIKVQIVLSDCR